MKIGLANRDGIVFKNFSAAELRRVGVQAVELYVPTSREGVDKAREHLEVIVDLGLEPVIHLTHEVADEVEYTSNLTTVCELLDQWDPIRCVVIHPSEMGANREERALRTRRLADTLFAFSLDGRRTYCIENLPYDPAVPDRFGDDLSEVVNVAYNRDSGVCLDTGHYLSSLLRDGSSSFDPSLAALVGHVHVHAFVNGKDHHPLQDDEGILRRLLNRFREFRPDYDGVLSIEITPFEHPPRSAVLGSIETLKEWLA